MIITNFEQLKQFIGVPGLYKFRFLTNFYKQYCGEADDLWDRLINQYRDEINSKSDKKKQRPIIKAIKKYSWENIEIEIIDYGEHLRNKNIRIMLETSCILEYNCLIGNGCGYNVLLGGFNRAGTKHTPETCKKMSENSARYNLGREFSKEHRKNISKGKMGIPCPEHVRQLFLGRESWFKGKHHTPAVIEQLKQNGKNQDHSYAEKSVKQIDKNTNEVIKVWKSMQEAEKFYNKNTRRKFPSNNISPTCIKHQKSAYGFKWEYVEENQISQEISQNP